MGEGKDLKATRKHRCLMDEYPYRPIKMRAEQDCLLRTTIFSKARHILAQLPLLR